MSQEEVKYALFLKAFNRISLEEEVVNGKAKNYWVVLPATPEDMLDVIKQASK